MHTIRAGMAGRRRLQWIAAMAALVVLVATVVVMAGDDGDTGDDHALRAGDGPSTTEHRTTTTESPATTEPSTTEPPATEPTTAVTARSTPPTVASTSTTTTTAPRREEPGSLDMAAVLVFAQGDSKGTAPAADEYWENPKCPDRELGRVDDHGDDDVQGIENASLVHFCDGLYGFALLTTCCDDRSRELPVDAIWWELDTGPGGCGGVDHVVIGWGPQAERRGAVVETYGCDAGVWRWIDQANHRYFGPNWWGFELRDTALGSPAAFDWSASVQAEGESGDEIDRVPDTGRLHASL